MPSPCATERAGGLHLSERPKDFPERPTGRPPTLVPAVVCVPATPGRSRSALRGRHEAEVRHHLEAVADSEHQRVALDEGANSSMRCSSRGWRGPCRFRCRRRRRSLPEDRPWKSAIMRRGDDVVDVHDARAGPRARRRGASPRRSFIQTGVHDHGCLCINVASPCFLRSDQKFLNVPR